MVRGDRSHSDSVTVSTLPFNVTARGPKPSANYGRIWQLSDQASWGDFFQSFSQLLMPKRFDRAEFSTETLQTCKQHNWSYLLGIKQPVIFILIVWK